MTDGRDMNKNLNIKKKINQNVLQNKNKKGMNASKETRCWPIHN